MHHLRHALSVSMHGIAAGQGVNWPVGALHELAGPRQEEVTGWLCSTQTVDRDRHQATRGRWRRRRLVVGTSLVLERRGRLAARPRRAVRHSVFGRPLPDR
jgi:hypothetical protein